MTTISSRALDTGEICRLCLSEDGEFVSIFKEEDHHDEDERMPMASRIMTISPVEVHEGDGLPELVCQRCIQMLDQACHFRDQCERSDAVLRHHYGRLWPETNPQLQKLLKEDQVVKKNLNADFPVSENDSDEATCLVTVKQEKDEEDGSQSPPYDDDYDEPQDYSMDDDARQSKLEPEDLSDKPSIIPTQFGYLDINNLKNMFHQNEPTQQEPISFALRETQNTTVPKVQPTPLTIPNISVSLIRKNIIAHEAQAQAQAQAQDQSKSRRWRKTNEPCTICGKCFKDRFAMKVHLRTHSGEKPFVCQVCGKAFRQKAHLGKHSFTHSAQRRQQQAQQQQAHQPQTQQHSSSPLSAAQQQPTTVSNNVLSAAEVKAKLARLSTSLQAKPVPKIELTGTPNPQPITVPIPVFPRLQRQASQSAPDTTPTSDSLPKPALSPAKRSTSTSPIPADLIAKSVSPPLVPKVAQPLLLPKPMLSVPQIAPKGMSASNAPPVAFYVMANGILPQNVVVGNGTGFKK